MAFTFDLTFPICSSLGLLTDVAQLSEAIHAVADQLKELFSIMDRDSRQCCKLTHVEWTSVEQIANECILTEPRSTIFVDEDWLHWLFLFAHAFSSTVIDPFFRGHQSGVGFPLSWWPMPQLRLANLHSVCGISVTITFQPSSVGKSW